MSKPILFYSEYCEHSKVIVTMILKYQLRSSFTIHCVDNNCNLPNEIDRVPMLMHDNKFLSDEGLFEYIEHIANTATVRKDVSPFLVSEMGNSLSDKYSYIEDDESANITHSFVHLKNGEQVNNERIYTPEDDSGHGAEKNVNYDDLISKRENEITGLTPIKT